MRISRQRPVGISGHAKRRWCVKVALFTVAPLLLLFGLPTPSVAQGDGVLRVIPYDGFLTDSGQVIDGSVAMRFALFNSDDDLVWSSEYSDEASRSCGDVPACLVPVYRGVFSVLLGQYVSVEDFLQLAAGEPDEMQLGLELRDGDGTWIALGGRQLLVPEPYSLWAAEGTEFTVSGNLTVGGLVASGNLLAEGGTVSVDGPVTVSGTVDSPLLGANVITASGNIRVNNASAGGALNVGTRVCFDNCRATGYGALAHDTGNTLLLNDGGYFAGGTRVDGVATVDGNFVTDGDVRLLGDVVSTNWTIDGDRPWIVTGYINMGTTTWYKDLEFSTADWFCYIGGYRFGSGDINEGDVTNIMELHTYTRTDEVNQRGEWAIRMDFASHSDEHESHRVSYVCLQRALVDVQSWSF